MTTESAPMPRAPRERTPRRDWLHDGLLVVILMVAAYLRFVGINWDEYTHLHPDERFLTMVESSLRLPANLAGYFNTAASPLNPHNTGHGFFVYGTLPIFLVRLLGEWVGRTGYDEIHLVGRAASAFFDLLTIALVYLIGERLYRRRVGLLASLFVAFSPLLIQHAHFFVVDSFLTAFIAACIYFALLVQAKGRWLDYALFGLALGMAAATKVNAAPVSLLVVLAVAARAFTLPPAERQKESVRMLGGLALAAGLSLLAFRLFQPYAFAGPGFFDIRPNPQWLENIRSLMQQASGDVDFPPALQWANRTPVFFALRNLVLWGMGPAAAICAWVGWGFALYRSFRGEWRSHIILVSWTGVYFLWQSVSFTPSMRYMMPVYPTLAVLASWFLWTLWFGAGRIQLPWGRVARVATGVLIGGVVLASAAQAFAFHSIYTRPLTRVAASRWIYANVPGPANLLVRTAEGQALEPISLPLDFILVSGTPFESGFNSQVGGTISNLALTHITDLTPSMGAKLVRLEIVAADGSLPLATTVALLEEQGGETQLAFTLEDPLPVEAGVQYLARLQLDGPGAVMLRGTLNVAVDSPEGARLETVGFPTTAYAVATGRPHDFTFVARQDGEVEGVSLPFVRPVASAGMPGNLSIKAEVFEGGQEAQGPIASGSLKTVLDPSQESKLEIPLSPAFDLRAGTPYIVRLHLEGPVLALRGSVIVSESTWDDGLPVRVDGRDLGGIYDSAVQELYWQDDQDDDFDGVPDKLERIVDTLTEGDFLAITSNRQYGTIPRVPQRYPLTDAYYRALMDCPEGQSVLACLAYAQPGKREGRLGYELVETFESNLMLGPLEISDQLAEEAFTVYDHPKVLIFSKQPGFSGEAVAGLLGQVDLSRVVHVTPKQAGDPPPDLMLPEDAVARQRQGGTFAELFPRTSLLNRSPVVAVAVWWLLIGAIGVIAFPLVRVAFPGLRDGGYPLARAVGLVVVAWGAWMLGSAGVTFSRVSILAVLALLAALSAALAWRDRARLAQFWREHKREIAWIEILALSLFLLDLAIRIGNPDLWHPSKGGEKPMDLSYLTAILKSSTFPPYDPWFAGGYINYYYYGFMLAAVPIRLLGIMPATAYNLVLPTFFSVLGLVAYSGGYNLVARTLRDRVCSGWKCARTAGLAAALAMVLLGNLGTANLVYTGLKRIGAPPADVVQAGLPGMLQAARGAGRYVTFQSSMPYGLDSWYWDPSRAIPPAGGEAGPITEFPFFTFLYADLHAHMFGRVLSVLLIVWLLSWLVHADERGRLKIVDVLLAFWVGALILGALGPTNLADAPDYTALAAAAMVASAWLRHRKVDGMMILESVLVAAALLGLSRLVYAPYHQWYGEAYGAVERWKGSTTTLGAYFVVHGLFLFTVACWMGWETRQWMANTPLAVLGRYRRYFGAALVLGVLVALVTVVGAALGFPISLVVVPLLVWAGLLFLRPGQPVEKRYALVLLGAGLALTSLVEVVVARGDISRMNTVFKFYMQVWELFVLSAAAALAWTWADVRLWSAGWRRAWSIGLTTLVLCALAYPLTATSAKVRDRMANEAPRGIDGMAFMPFATYYDLGGSFSLADDYAAIQWMQDNVAGSPVIVEANVPEYRWGSRFTVYTGLPGVLGWNWHQRQQRLVAGDGVVTERALAINDFYLTRSIDEAMAFLEEYDVQYIIVGELERLYFEELGPCSSVEGADGVVCELSGWPMGMPQPSVTPADCAPIDPSMEGGALRCPTFGLSKFPAMVEQGLIQPVFAQGNTTIYEVVR